MKLKDISREAGVAVSTVSRVLKDPDSSAASLETKEKIYRIALRGGYISEIPGPDPFADAIPSSTPTKILYCMLAVDPDERNDSPFFTRLIESIRAAAHHYNYIVEYYFPSDNEGMPLPLTSDYSKAVRGIIVIGRSLPSFIEDLQKQFDNVLYIGITDLDLDCDQVICSGRDAAWEVVHLFNKYGHEKIGFLGPSDDDRMKGYLQAMNALSLPVDPDTMISDTRMSYDGGYSGMKELLAKRETSGITAVFCANDNSAIGALQACKELNVPVPGEIALIGMDGGEMTKYLTPSISTVYSPLEEMGKFAVRVLRDRIHGGHSQNVKINFPFEIIRRGSGPVKKTQ